MPLGIDEEGKLDEATLRRFVFQTYGRSRRTQDSPIMPDVWLRYIRVAEKIAHWNIDHTGRPDDVVARPSDVVDLLLTPWSGVRPGRVAARLRESLKPTDATGTDDARRDRHVRARIALSDSRVVICATFETLACHIVPLSGWWQELFKDDKAFEEVFNRIDIDPARPEAPRGRDTEFSRYVALVGFIDGLLTADSQARIERLAEMAYRLGPLMHDADSAPGEKRQLTAAEGPLLREIYDRARRFLWHAVPASTGQPATTTADELARGIFLISLNRLAAQTLFESRGTVKADAAQRVFEIDTTGIAFAVIDGGIDATHPAFLDRSNSEIAELGSKPPPDDAWLQHCRVKATYDFTILRDVIHFAQTNVEPKDTGTSSLPEEPPVTGREETRDERIRRLYRRYTKEFEHLSIRNFNARDLDWEIVEPIIRIPHNSLQADPPYIVPKTDHGTHVAGILAADLPKRSDKEPALLGMCQRLTLYDLRVFDSDGRGDEFAILCALEFVGWLNRDRTNPVVHGVNLSLALAHDVDSFACGQTPICEACNHLVGSGTVVVASAGNTGFEDGASAEKQSIGTGYRAISITDPGNADLVITVGSTHRRDPHLYGVSYFSARGPTGDGRRKPDILAPGEKITSTIPGGERQRMDGTSMASPHVAGAAALLMARYPELIGRPQRIKEILMETATDLKREPSFQGAGLVDVLRALQSV